MSATQSTPLGDLPADWQVKTVSGLASPARNSIVGGPFGSDLVSKDYAPAGVPVIRGQNMTGKWLSGDFAFVSKEKADSLSANMAFPGDVIFTQRGTLGQVSLVPEKPFERYLISQSQMKLAVNDSTDALFLYYVFTSEKWQRKFAQDTIQTGVPHINLGILKNIEVPLPPLSEQRAIAGALGDIDAWIGAQEALRAKKRDLKTATMAQLLTGQIRLAGFDGDWQTKTLGEIGECVSGLTYSPSEVNANGLLVLRSSNVQKGRLDFEDTVYVNKVVQERIIVVENDILICVRNGSSELIGKCAMIGNNPKRMTFGAFMTVFRTPHAPFVFYQFQSDVIKKQIKEHLGATINQITNKSLNSFEIKLPALDEQIAIAGILSGLDEELAALDAQLDKTRQLKAATMTALLSGAKRLV